MEFGVRSSNFKLVNSKLLQSFTLNPELLITQLLLRLCNN